MSEFNFNLGSSDLESTQLAPFLNQPYLGGLKLVEVNVEDVEGRDGGATYEIVDFVFEMQDAPVAGFQHRHRIFNFKAFDQSDLTPEEQAAKWASRLAYLMKYFIGEENSIKVINASSSWSELRTNIDKAFTQLKDSWADKVVQGKIVGYINGNGKAILDFPRYIGFMADAESKTPLSFGKKEREANQAYAAAQNASDNATSGDALAGAAAAESAGSLNF